MQYISEKNLITGISKFKGQLPFDHCIIDGFFKEEIAHEIEKEFPDYENENWYYYKNAIEDKKALNNWNMFPELTYKIFQELMSDELIKILKINLEVPIYIDHGLHGGGWHIHANGGNLNPHLDYSIHPKMTKLRKLNIIIYLSSKLKEIHGGHLGLWENIKENDENQPGKLIKEIEPKFNRAVIFDTTQMSWHGMSRKLSTPDNVYRKSLAIYYLTESHEDSDRREKALFAPRDFQKKDKNIIDLIKIRSDTKNYHKAYKDE